MQQKNWPQTIKGNLRIELTGNRLAEFINRATGVGMDISQIVRVAPTRIRLTIAIPDYWRLRPILRETGSKMRILNKQGLPFWLARIKRRRFFVWGMVLFVILIFSLTSMVWSVEVEGNETVPTAEILSVLKKEGVFVGQLKSRMPDNLQIQYRLTQQMPHLSWAGFRIEGTRAIVTVVEKKRVEEGEKSGEKGPINLVAKRAGLIYDLRVERGRPVVEVNDVVKKGQLLVSGRYGDPENPKEGKLVGAKGSVLGEVWYESEVSVPLIQKRKVYTGNRERAYYPYLASRVIRLPFLYPDTYRQVERIQRVHALRARDWRLPFGWVEEERMEMTWVKQKLSVREAIAIGRSRAREDLLARLGEHGRILEEKILHPRRDNGKVVLKIHFDVVEDIASPQPILQGE
ncbi:sporulation protein YqfD [Salinithrix halophila]|uniref:Sporulation protein YqfD n=1 Tax=Salinithrix halophila TaxID=1485204 RepID=A0ABV8JHC3_9BACL